MRGIIKQFKQTNDYYFYLPESDNPVFVFVGKLNFNEVEFQGLKVGDKVNRIGDNNRSGQAALNRMQVFITYVTYVGLFKENIYSNGNSANMLLFKLNEDERPAGIAEECYIGYIIIESEGRIELRVPDLKTNNPVYIIRPKFGVLNTTIPCKQ